MQGNLGSPFTDTKLLIKFMHMRAYRAYYRKYS